MTGWEFAESVLRRVGVYAWGSGVAWLILAPPARWLELPGWVL